MKLFALTIFIATYIGATFSQQQDREYEGDGNDVDKNRLGCDSDALREAMKISEAARKKIPWGTPNCGDFKKFSKNPCPPRDQWNWIKCDPKNCQVTDDIAFTRCKLPVKLLVPYPIASKECQQPARRCGNGCSCQTIWCVKWFKQYVKNDHGCFLTEVWKKYPCKCECRKTLPIFIPLPPIPKPFDPSLPLPPVPWIPKTTPREYWHPKTTAVPAWYPKSTTTRPLPTLPPWYPKSTTQHPWLTLPPWYPKIPTQSPWPTLPPWFPISIPNLPGGETSNNDDENKWEWLQKLG